MKMSIPKSVVAILALVFSQALPAANATFTLTTPRYYKNGALVSAYPDFVSGKRGSFTSFDTQPAVATYACNATMPEGYYASKWQLDRAWGVRASGEHVQEWGEANSISVTFDYDWAWQGKSLELVVSINPMRYDLKYNSSGASWIDEPDGGNYSYFDKLTVPAKSCASKPGYTPVGWNTKKSGAGKTIDSGEQISGKDLGVSKNGETVTLYLQWQANTYAVTLNANGGTCAWELTSYTYGKDTPLPTASKKGCTFVGWYETPDFSGTAVSSISGAAMGDKTYYAKYTSNKYDLVLTKGAGIAEIRYKVNGATSYTRTSQTETVVKVEYDSTWYAYATAEEAYTYSETSAENPKSARMGDAGAVFAPVATLKKYGLELKVGKGIAAIYYKVGDAKVYTCVTETTAVPVSYSTKWSAYATAAAGYSYSETSPEKPQTGVMGTDGATFAPKGVPNQYGLVLTMGKGIRAIRYKASASDSWHETDETATISVTYGDVWSAYALAAEGYSYTATTVNKPATGTMGTAGAAFAPVGAPNVYTIRYHKNVDKTDTTSDDARKYGVAGKLKTYAGDLKWSAEGCRFDGWATAASGEVVYADGQTVSNLTSQAGAVVHLYAKYTPYSYVVYFGRGSKGKGTQMLPQEFQYAKSAKLPKVSYTSDNYRFRGWAESSGGAIRYADEETVTFRPTGVKQTKTLYAIWERKVCILRFDANGGTGGDAMRIIPRGSAATCNANIFPSYNAGLFSEMGAGLSLAGNVFTVDCENAGGTAAKWPRFQADALDIVVPGDKYTVVLDVLSVGRAGADKICLEGRNDARAVQCQMPAVAGLAGTDVKAGARFVANVTSQQPSVHPNNVAFARGVVRVPAGASSKLTFRYSVFAGTATIPASYAGVAPYDGYILRTLPTPTRSGHTFVGWYTAKDGGTRVTNATKITDSQTLYARWTPNQYDLKLKKGTGISAIYYKTNSVSAWTKTTSSTTVKVEFGTKWYAYAEAAEGYVYTATTSAKPATGTMGTKGATFAPVGTPLYDLVLKKGTGIKDIYYKVNGATTYTRATKDVTTVQVAYKTVWSAYAVAAEGYSYTATSEAKPMRRTKWAETFTFAPVATPKKYDLVLTKGTGIAAIRYKVNGAKTYAKVTTNVTLKVNYDSDWFAYAEAVPGYTSSTSEAKPATGTMTMKGATYAFVGDPKQYDLVLKKGTGIEAIYYRVNGAKTYTRVTSSTTVPVAYKTVWFAYAEAAEGYSYTATSVDNPEKHTMWMQPVTFAPVATPKKYDLVLTKGTGIAAIYYKVNGARDYVKTTTNATLKVNFDSEWYAYAEASEGYSYTATSEAEPQTGTMTTKGATFAPVGTPAQYDLTLKRGTGIAAIYYRVNGATSYAKTTSGMAVKVKYGTKWYAYAEAAEGYSYTAASEAKPATGTMGTSGATFAPVGKINTYKLTLMHDESIAAIYFKTNSIAAYQRLTKETNVLDVVYGSKWYAYATPSEGYVYTEYTAESPLTKTMGAEADSFTFKGTERNRYTLTLKKKDGHVAAIRFRINGETKYARTTEETTNVWVFACSEWFAYAEPAAGYTGVPPQSSPHREVMPETKTNVVFEVSSTANNYTIAFTNFQDGVRGEMSTQPATYDKPLQLNMNRYSHPDSAIKFVGWTNDQGRVFADRAWVTNLTTVADATVWLYAKWEKSNRYTIKFDPNGGSGTMDDMSNCVSGVVTNLTACTYAEPLASMGFDHWEFDGKSYADGVKFLYNAKVDGETITLKAVWKDEGKYSKAVGLKNAVLKQNGMGWATSESEGREGSSCVKCDFEGQSVGETATMSMQVQGPGMLTYWWKREDSGAGVTAIVSTNDVAAKALSAGDWRMGKLYVASGGITKIAWELEGMSRATFWLDDVRWVPGGPEYCDVAVAADPADAGTVTGGGLGIVAGTEIELTATNNPGYVFARWFDGSAENPHRIEVVSNATYTALFSAKTNVLNLVVGRGIAEIRYRANGADESSTATNATVLVGYLGSWWADADAAVGYHYDGGETNGAMTAGSARFAPTGTPNVITVRYDGNGGTGATPATTFRYDEGGFLASNKFAKSYAVTFAYNHDSIKPTVTNVVCAFAGWRDADGTYRYAAGQCVTNVCGSTGGDVDLYADWQNGSVKLPDPGSYAEHTFAGWYDAKTGGNRIGDAGDTYEPTASATLHAQWQEDVGALSKAVGLTNAKLDTNNPWQGDPDEQDCWVPQGDGKGLRFVHTSGELSDDITLYMSVAESGELSFDWRASGLGDVWSAELSVGGKVVCTLTNTDAKTASLTNDVTVSGSTTIKWVVHQEYDDYSDVELFINNVRWTPQSALASPKPTAADRRNISSLSVSDANLRLTFAEADARFDYQVHGTNDLVAPRPWPVLWTTNGTGTISVDLPKTDASGMSYYLEVIQKQP